jgi:hypothetical protein
MSINNPFGFLSANKTNETNVLDDLIFTNNKGLALLVLTIIATLVAIWDVFLGKMLAKYVNYTMDKDSFLKKYGSWFVRIY